MKNNIPSLQTLVQNYFLQRLIQQRRVSEQTVCSYRDTFRIYFEFLQKGYAVKASEAVIELFDLEYLQEFCKYLEADRGNKPVTINNRLAALKSFMQYVAETEPEYSAFAKRALMIPTQKYETPSMDFISKEEFGAMIDVCDTTTQIGARDKLMLLLLYNTGARVSEMLEIKCCDLQFSDTPCRINVRLHGKGRKERIVPLWKNTTKYIEKYISANGLSPTDFLFINKNGERLTRSGVRSRISKITEIAAYHAPSLKEKLITPHTFRHSVAMNLLHSGVDISTIAILLGHSSIETTHKYMVADLELKREAMEKAGEAAENSSCRYHPSEDIIGFLKSL